MAGIGLLSLTVSAQTLTVLKTFSPMTLNTNISALTNNDGAGPGARLLLSGGTLFGTAEIGGKYGYGTLFKMGTNGNGFTVLHSFSNTFGQPRGILVSNNTVYGMTTEERNSGDYGGIYSVDTNGNGFMILHEFTNIDSGLQPSGCLLLSGGVLYGTTQMGGNHGPFPDDGYGMLFKLNTDGSGFMPLHEFTVISAPYYTNSDGDGPASGLTIVGNTLYGTAPFGGIYGYGTVFKIDTDGNNFAALHYFNVTDGNNPYAELVPAGNDLYGVLYGGWGDGFLFTINTANNEYASLFAFPSGVFGFNAPNGELFLVGGTLFGTSHNGSKYGVGTPGTVFEINTNVSGFASIFSFPLGNYNPKGYLTNADGGFPTAGLVVDGSTAYGAAGSGGTNGNGTIYRLDIPAVLSITASGTNLLVTWPSLNTGYTLESATNLASPAWTAVSPPAFVVNNLYTATNSKGGKAKYFRLFR